MYYVTAQSIWLESDELYVCMNKLLTMAHCMSGQDPAFAVARAMMKAEAMVADADMTEVTTDAKSPSYSSGSIIAGDLFIVT